MLLIEDLHWSSDSLLDLVEFILQPRADAPMLVLALARPELLERRPTWGGGRRNHVSLALQPLDDRAIGELVNDLLEGPAPGLVSLVARRAEGNPFYAGEIVRTLLESGVDPSDTGALDATARGLPGHGPGHGAGQAGCARARGAARPATGIGPRPRLQPRGRAGHRAERRDQPGSAVDELIDRELLRPGRRGELTFRHIIIRDVAYGMLPRSERAALHAAVGRWLEQGAGDRGDELAELIAFHLREAVSLVPAFQEADPALRSSAVTWLLRAAEVSATGRALVEATRHLDAALELASPPEQPAIHQRLGELLGSGDRAVQAYARAWQLGEAQGLPASFLLRSLARQLMVITRWFASVAQPIDEREIQELRARGQGWFEDADERHRPHS